MRALAAALLLVSTPALAAQGDLWLDINGLSYHDKESRCYRDAGVCKKFNELNYGAGLSYGVRDWADVSIGYYRNSYFENTFYAAGTLKYDVHLGDFTVSPGIKLGIATGYERDFSVGGLTPNGLLVLQVQYDRFRLEAGAAPYRLLGFSNTNLFTLNAGVRF